jgi:hypothetical protein
MRTLTLLLAVLLGATANQIINHAMPIAQAAPLASAPECISPIDTREKTAKPDIAAIIAALPAVIKPMRQDQIASLINQVEE